MTEPIRGANGAAQTLLPPQVEEKSTELRAVTPEPAAPMTAKKSGWLQTIGAWLGFGGAAEKAVLFGASAGAQPKQGVSLQSGAIGLPSDPIDKLLYSRHAASISRGALVSNHPVTAGNKAELLVDGEAAFVSMLQAIDRAKDFISVSFFIFEDDKYGRILADKLAGKAAQGVKVRVLLDESGSLIGEQRSVPRVLSRLKKAGVEVINNYLLRGEPGEILSSSNKLDADCINGFQRVCGGFWNTMFRSYL